MKTIKIFLASSEELDYDRMVFGNLVRRLDDIYEKRGIRIKLFEWEDYDAAFNDRRKQDEYNDNVRESDIFLALFHKKAGKFTIEEFDIASEEFQKHASPKVFTFCKDLKADEEESPELAEFKKRLFDEMGHYWCRYDSRESLQLQFVMQLQLVESSKMGELKVENGNITMDGIRIAPMDKLRFAAANEDYVKMQTEMIELYEETEEMQLDLEKKRQKLEKKKAKLEKDPDDEEYQEEKREVEEEIEALNVKLQPKLNKYNKLKEDFEQFQQLLFNTAKRVAQLQGERITERMRRAMDAFSEGKVREANIILDQALVNDEQEFEDFKQSKEITELKRQKIIRSIEAYWFRANTIMADASLPIEERITQAEKNYEHADDRAKKTDYDKKKHVKLLMEYGSFLCDYAKYEKAIEVYQRVIALSEAIYGAESLKTATAYNNIALVYKTIDKYQEAKDFHFKALSIEEKLLGERNLSIASSYNNIGNLYSNLGDYSTALDYGFKALEIRIELLGKYHHDTSTSCHNIASYYYELGNYSEALKYFEIAIEISEKMLGEHPDTANSYCNIGLVYDGMGDYEKALEYYSKALAITEKTLGTKHPAAACLYNNIGCSYESLNDYPKALEYLCKAIEINESALGDNTRTANSYDAVGSVQEKLGNYPKALEYYSKAFAIREKVLGPDHPDTVNLHCGISEIYRKSGLEFEKQDKYQEALDCYNKALAINEKVLGKEHKNTKSIYKNIGSTYIRLGDYQLALNYLIMTLPANESLEGESDNIGNSFFIIGALYDRLKNYNKAYEYNNKALAIFEKVYPEENPLLTSARKKNEELKQKLSENEQQ